MKKCSKVQPCALTIAGSDSGGNAGVQADLRAFHMYGIHGCTTFAALTAQNPKGVKSVHVVPCDFIRDQLETTFAMYSVKALKTGMLATTDVIKTVAKVLRKHPEVKMVIDPVMVATSGAKLIQDDAIAALQRHLLPLATLITPNMPEAEVLLGRSIETVGDQKAAAKELSAKFGCAVLVKGGHGKNDATDVLFDGKRFHTYSLPMIESPISTHGTGCSLAAALAAELALGRSVAKAVAGAKQYVYDAIRTSYLVGPSCGVLGMARRL